MRRLQHRRTALTKVDPFGLRAFPSPIHERDPPRERDEPSYLPLFLFIEPKGSSRRLATVCPSARKAGTAEDAHSLLSPWPLREHDTDAFILGGPPHRPWQGQHENRRLRAALDLSDFAGGAWSALLSDSRAICVSSWTSTYARSISRRSTGGNRMRRHPANQRHDPVRPRTLSSEQPREGLPAPRARDAIHRACHA